jgi:hypothetical protein
MAAQDLPYRWRNERGNWIDTVGRLYRPETGDGPFPLIYYAGYEADPSMAAAWTNAGLVVVTPQLLADDGEWPHGNPIGRGLKMDEALLRAARALPFVDDRRVVITGGSAGGYMTMMTSAATFPLAGAMPLVPPVNLPYGMATWRYNVDEIRSLRADGKTNVMAHPGSDGISGLWLAVSEWHGIEGEKLWQWSPLAHLDQITCPVVVLATSADALVPIPQFGGPLVAKAAAEAPDVYPIDPDVVCTDDVQRRTLLGLLPPDEVEVHVVEVPADTPVMVDVENPPPGVVLPAPLRSKRWLVIFLDEGGPTPDVGHFKHAVGIDFVPHVQQFLTGEIGVEQLTQTKLELLADRWLGRDWIQPSRGDRGLTDEELAAEREDVIRGLSTYRAVSPDHEARLQALVGQLDDERSAALADALRSAPVPVA